jgi:hypothetical protein
LLVLFLKVTGFEIPNRKFKSESKVCKRGDSGSNNRHAEEQGARQE